MRVLIAAGPEEVANAVAERVAAEAAKRTDLVLALPTGRTAEPLYAGLARRRRSGGLDLARARGLNLDELVLPPSHPASFRSFMERHAWGTTGLSRERCDIPRGDAADLDAECARYDAAIDAAGGIDLALLGIGSDGHVAYNLPGPPHERTHVVAVPDRVADRLAIDSEHRPLRAITMGMAPLRTADRVVLVALTADKAAAIRALVDGPADPGWPASLLRDHPSFDVLVTPEAAAASETLRELGARDALEVG